MNVIVAGFEDVHNRASTTLRLLFIFAGKKIGEEIKVEIAAVEECVISTGAIL